LLLASKTIDGLNPAGYRTLYRLPFAQLSATCCAPARDGSL